jgi:bifunctional DNA-binding transcriptional regulator/antitoxin component of YhaV-PrlF toxin-antitoxin module
MARLHQAAARLGSRNQLTLPIDILEAARIQEGDSFLVDLDQGDPDVIILRRVRTTYAGALSGMYAPVEGYIGDERSGWG